MFFQFPLEQVTEVIVLGERLSNFHLTILEHSLKMFSFFEFSGSFKIIVAFLGLFHVIVSVLSIYFSSDLNLKKKQIVNAV